MAPGELTDVTAKVGTHEAFVEGKLEAPKHLARTVHDLYFEPKYEEFRPRTIWGLSNAFPSALKELSRSPIQNYGESRRVSGGSFLAVLLAVMVGPAGPLLAETVSRPSRPGTQGS